MKNKIFKLIINVLFVVFWQQYGFEFFIAGLEQLQLTQYFTNIPLWIAFYISLMFVPPVWFTYYLWITKKQIICFYTIIRLPSKALILSSWNSIASLISTSDTLLLFSERIVLAPSISAGIINKQLLIYIENTQQTTKVFQSKHP